MTSATRNRKPRPKPIRRCRLSGPTGAIRVLEIWITTPRVKSEPKVEHFGYFVTAAPSDFGTAFKLERFAHQVKPGEPTHYETCLNGEHSLCSCPGFERWGMAADDGRGCKHISSLTALKAAGRL